MTVARRLQIPAASTVVVLGSPDDVDLDRLAWIAYPRSGSSAPTSTGTS